MGMGVPSEREEGVVLSWRLNANSGNHDSYPMDSKEDGWMSHVVATARDGLLFVS